MKPYYFLAGVIGALFVMLYSVVIPRLGALKTAILIIAGEMFSGVLIDSSMNKVDSVPLSVLGVGLIIAGMLVTSLHHR